MFTLNRMKKMNYLIACLLSLAVLSSCSDDNKPAPDPVLSPIAKHIIGKWKLVEQVIQKDGEWVDTPSTGTLTITFRPDGTLPGVYITSSGRSNLSQLNWGDVNEEDHTITMEDFKCRILNLTENEMEIITAQTPDGMIESKEIYHRIDNEPQTIAERLVGRWTLAQRYEKVNGEWVEITDNLPAEHWCEYTEAGTYTRWSNGEEQQSEDTEWMMYEPEGVMAYGDMIDWKFSYFRLALEDDYTRMVMNYAEDYDPDLDEQVNTEYKDILMKVK